MLESVHDTGSSMRLPMTIKKSVVFIVFHCTSAGLVCALTQACGAGLVTHFRFALSYLHGKTEPVSSKRITQASEFIEAPPRSGCGWPLDKVEDLLKDDQDTLRLYRQALLLSPGKRTDLDDNITEVRRSTGTSKAYTLDRLSREAPILYQAVCGGEMSANKS